MNAAPRVTVWHEHRHEKTNPAVAALYPKGMHVAIGDAVAGHLPQAVVGHALLDDPEHGLTDAVLAKTDVMFWWGHGAHEEVDDAIAAKVQQRVLEGMGLVVLHSGHYSKPFKRLLGTGCHLSWREDSRNERLWCVFPGHPLTQGLDLDPQSPCIDLPETEMYGEPFDVPPPDELVFISWFAGGEVFRSGCVWQRGRGKIVYLRPGHETFGIYYHPQIKRLLANAAQYAAPSPEAVAYRPDSPNAEPKE